MFAYIYTCTCLAWLRERRSGRLLSTPTEGPFVAEEADARQAGPRAVSSHSDRIFTDCPKFNLESLKFFTKHKFIIKNLTDFRKTLETGMDPRLRSRSRTFFRTGCYTSHKNQKSETAVRRELRFFVFIREDSKFNRLQVSSQRQHFLFSYFKDTLF